LQPSSPSPHIATQFNGLQAIDGNIGDTTFGQIINATLPRILRESDKSEFEKRIPRKPFWRLWPGSVTLL
jgi:hypothetical protein